MLHAKRNRILWKITIPMVMPAMLSTFLLVFSSSMSSFAVPAFLGLPVRYQVLTTVFGSIDFAVNETVGLALNSTGYVLFDAAGERLGIGSLEVI